MQNWTYITRHLPTTVLFALIAVVGVAAALPDVTNASKPNPEPAAQIGWDKFTPPVSSASPMSGVASIAEWTHTGGPDDSLVVTGDMLSNHSGVDEGKDTQFLVYGQTNSSDAVQSSALIQRLDGLKTVITLPSTLPAWSTYLLWPRNSSGYGFPVAINRTEAWWVGPDQATRGDTVSVYGRNLSHNGGTSISWVYLKPLAAAGQWVAPTSANPYRVQFVVPASLGNGTYEIWVHNGHGGSYGWSGPTSLTVTDGYQWNGNTFNVHDFGTVGDGVADDTAAVESANLAAATYRDSHPGLHPTVYFPAGTYNLSRGISLQQGLRYLGADKDSSVLRCTSGFNGSAVGEEKLGLLIGKRGGGAMNIEVKDMTLDANGNFPKSGYLVTCDWYLGASDQKFTGVRFKTLAPGTSCLALSNVTRIFIADCEFYGGELFTHEGRQQFISHCSFYNANDQLRSIGELRVSELSITDSRFQDYDIQTPEGRGQGRLLAGSALFGAQFNTYIGDNTTVAFGPNPEVNAGEQILCEGATAYYKGHPVSATSTTAAFGDLDKDYSGQVAVISAGKGLGQFRRITGFNSTSKTITVTPAWNVSPDASSDVLIEASTCRWVIYHNTFEGKNYDPSVYTAMTAIVLAGGCDDWVGANNTISHMRHGLYNTGGQQSNSLVDIHPCYFNYFTNNSIQSSYDGICHGAGIQPTSAKLGVLSIGNSYSHNTFSDITTTGVVLRIWAGSSTPPTPVVEASVIEHNTFKNLPSGANLDYSNTGGLTTNPILYRNSFARGTAAFSGSYGARIGANNAPAFNGNSWVGFETNYQGTLPGAILEVTSRIFDQQAASVVAQANLTIRNAGTASLSWSASSDSSWLTLSSSKGTVADENSASSVTFSCNPAGLPPGSYSGTITITANSQTKKVTVTLLAGIIAPGQASISVSVK